jgi:ribosome maturation factor RimP
MSCLTEEIVSPLQTEIETRLADVEPDVEVLLAEVVSGATLRLFIDHPDGVTLSLCERVSARLNDYRERYSLEVSSPGADRPLTKPQHFRRFLGRKVRVRLWEASRPHVAGSTSMGRRSVTGELVGASQADITVAAADGVITLPYDHILRCNLVPGD